MRTSQGESSICNIRLERVNLGKHQVRSPYFSIFESNLKFNNNAEYIICTALKLIETVFEQNKISNEIQTKNHSAKLICLVLHISSYKI